MKLIKPSFEVMTDLSNTWKMLRNIETIGRVCYKSENRITDDSTKKFIQRIINSGHHSVIEHENITVRFIIDRGVSHELVRHRLAAYSQESTRYCNYSNGVTFIIPPWIEFSSGEWTFVELSEICEEEMDFIYSNEYTWMSSMLGAERDYIKLLDHGWSRQQARSVLPNSLKTEIVMTANIREWRHVFTLRTSKNAHPQMREIMIPLLNHFKSQIPVFFDDIKLS